MSVDDGGQGGSDAGIVAEVAAGGRDVVLARPVAAYRRQVYAPARGIVRDAAPAGGEDDWESF